MPKPIIKFQSFIIFILLNSVVLEAYSVSISARRLYLDPKNNATDIRVLNLDGNTQSCEVEVRDIVINSAGKIALSNEKTTNSAAPLVRLAPRRFTLGAKEHQMVKLLYRRKPSIENGEYQGVLAIKCRKQQLKSAASALEQVTIQPTLVHNVPVIVRTGLLPLTAKFSTISVIDDTLTLELSITGNRSITGDLALIDTNSGEVLSEIKDKSIYAENPKKLFAFNIAEFNTIPLTVRFSENPKFGGDLVIQQSIK